MTTQIVFKSIKSQPKAKISHLIKKSVVSSRF